jgi:signal transduction histidine kinase
MTIHADRPWDAFRSSLERSSVDLGEVCRRAASELRANTTRVAIDVHIRGEVDGEWDADCIELVVTSLLRHAIEHAAAGTLVTVDAWEDVDDCVAFAVIDEGRPIARDQFSSVFRGSDMRVAYEIVRAHGGNIEARSFEGKTVVGVTLPRARGQL